MDTDDGSWTEDERALATQMATSFVTSVAARPEPWVEAMLVVGIFPEPDSMTAELHLRVYLIEPVGEEYVWELCQWTDHVDRRLLNQVVTEFASTTDPAVLFVHSRNPSRDVETGTMHADSSVQYAVTPWLAPEMLDDLDVIAAFASGAITEMADRFEDAEGATARALAEAEAEGAAAEEWDDRMHDLPDWALTHAGVADAVRMVWHDWTMLVEVATGTTRGFLLWQPGWWLAVAVRDFETALDWDPETDEVDDQWEEWAELDVEARWENLHHAANTAVAAESPVDLVAALTSEEEHTLLVAGLLDLDDVLAEPVRQVREHIETGRLTHLAPVVAQVRAEIAEGALLPPYLHARYRGIEERSGHFEYSERDWSYKRQGWRAWRDPFPVAPADLPHVRRYLAAQQKHRSQAEQGRGPQARLVRVVRQEL